MQGPKDRFLPHLPHEQLAAIQLQGLQWTVAHAMNSPQYKAKFKAAGIESASQIRSLDDLKLLPFSSVHDLREGYPLPLLSVPEEDVLRIHASSGTTGKRKILAYTRKDIDTFALQMARCFELAGLSPVDRVQIAVGYGLWTAGVGFQAGSELFGAMTVPIGAGNLEMHLQMLVDMQSTCLCSTASMALLLAEEVERHNLLDKLALKKIIFGAEPHSLKMRQTFEEKLGLQGSYDIGGMTEMYGPGTSLNCEAREGLHYWADLFIFEIIDPHTLNPVPPGEVGELVVTSLCKEASPLVRYRTHDLTRLIPEPCSCGRLIPRHGHIRGRSDDMIIFRGVNIYPGQITDVLHQFPELGGEYHLTLSHRNGLDHMQLSLERAEGSQSGGDEALAAAVGALLHKKVMIRAEVQVGHPGSLPRSVGKAKRITDNRFS